LQANGQGNPRAERASAAMGVVNRHIEATGRKVMYAFNIADEIDAMARHAERLEKLGATAAVVSLNWIGVTGLRFLRERTSLPIHGHRNGWGLFSRSPDIGIAFPVMQKIWRMAGADHIHVNGLSNKFTEPDDVVIEAARSVQTVWQIGATSEVLGNQDFLFCAGGGIMSDPKSPAAGIAALRQVAKASTLGIPVADFAQGHQELAQVLERFKP